jgi:GPI-anchor transamidase subunit T
MPIPLLRTVSLFFIFVYLSLLVSGTMGLYAENLRLEPLPHNLLLASFNFHVRSHRDSEKSLISSTHYAHLPRSLGQILSNTHTHELHLRLTQGRWDEEWGSLPSRGEKAGGTGMEIWAWIEDDQVHTYTLLRSLGIDIIVHTRGG